MELDLSKTPGFLYGIHYWIALLMYTGFLKRRLSHAQIAAAAVGYLALMELWMRVTVNIPERLLIPCICVTFSSVVLWVRLTCRVNWPTAAYHAVRSYLLAEFMTSLQWQLLFFVVEGLGMQAHAIGAMVVLTAAVALLYIVFWKFEKNTVARYGELEVEWKKTLSVAVIMVIFLVVGNISYIYEKTPFSTRFPGELYIIRTVVDLCGVVILMMYHYQLQTVQSQVEVQTLQNMLNMQYQSYQVSQESVAMVNQKCHDLKHQIAYLRDEVSAEDKKAYLDQMEAEIRQYEVQNKTGNQVLDILLTSKSFQCQKQNIRLTCIADGKLLNDMEPMDLNALFGNALDNAIESVSKIEDPRKRLIHLTVAGKNQFVSICMENACMDTVHFEDGLPVTNKKDKNLHGYGVKSIRSIVEKYQGSLRMKQSDGWFEVRILIPIGTMKIHD